MLLGITTGGKIGLGLVAGIFIVFALVVSFLLPRRDPNFPGDRLGAFIGVALALFVATVGAVVFFAKEEEEAHGGAETTETHASTDTGAAETEPATTGGDTGAEGGGEGDAEAGAQVFDANGCGACHTLAAAGASGSVGPNLDESGASFEAAVTTITEGRGAMPAFGERLDEQQIRDVAAFVTGG